MITPSKTEVPYGDELVRDLDAWAEYMDELDHAPRTHAGRCAEAEAIDERSRVSRL